MDSGFIAPSIGRGVDDTTDRLHTHSIHPPPHAAVQPSAADGMVIGRVESTLFGQPNWDIDPQLTPNVTPLIGSERTRDDIVAQIELSDRRAAVLQIEWSALQSERFELQVVGGDPRLLDAIDERIRTLGTELASLAEVKLT
ncbi:MAG: hypothetical protein AAF772_05135 [Acidobacteriota bacterium]